MAGSTAQKLILTHAPAYVTVQQQSSPLSASDVPAVISDTLGLSESSVSVCVEEGGMRGMCKYIKCLTDFVVLGIWGFFCLFVFVLFAFCC